VATLQAELTIAADLDWGATSIRSVEASYSLVEATTLVSLKGWDQMMVWVVQTYGGKVTMQQLMEKYVQTPASPYVQLVGVALPLPGTCLPAAACYCLLLPAAACCCLQR
jgi:hypothetical protein